MVFFFAEARLLRAFWLFCLMLMKLRVDAFSCTWTDPSSGKFFDLRSLKKKPPESWIIPDDELIYSTNIVCTFNLFRVSLFDSRMLYLR